LTKMVTLLPAALMMGKYVHCRKLCMHLIIEFFLSCLLSESGFSIKRVCNDDNSNDNVSVLTVPISVTTLSESVTFLGHSNNGIVGSHPTQVLDVIFFCAVM
jgi:hypothetical protein